MALFQNNLLMGAASQSGSSGFSIDQSIRFNSGDSPYMYKTYGSAGGSRRKYTISVWFKIGKEGDGSSGTERNIFMAGAYGSDDGITLDENAKIKFSLNGTSSANLISTQVLRDHSSWYHVVVAVDTTQDITSDRVKIYLNNSQITSFSTSNYPTQNYDGNIINNVQHNIGARTGPNRHFDGYLADIVLLDNTVTTPASFGEFKEDSDIWVPKDVSELTFGTNGFWIDGRDSSDLGDDESGRGNDYTTSGLAATDQMVGESPTNNFAVFNPLLTNNSVFEYTEGNLKMDFNTSASWDHASGGSISMDSGKWYWEAYWTTGDSYSMFGILPTELIHMCAGSGSNVYLSGNFIQNRSGGSIIDLYRQVQGSTTTAGDFQVTNYLQFALDMDNKKFWCGVNGTYFSSGNPGAGSNELFTSTDVVSDSYTPAFLGYDISADTIIQLNFGQDSTFAGVVTAGGNSDGNGIGNFRYAVPSGFLALCTKNLGAE